MLDRNATIKQAKLDANHAREVARRENVVVKDASNVVVKDASNVVVNVATSNLRRSRRNTRTSSPVYSYICFTRCLNLNYDIYEHIVCRQFCSAKKSKRSNRKKTNVIMTS